MIDTHAHINHEKLTNVFGDIIKSLDAGKLEAIICPSYNKASSFSSFELSQKYQKVFSALAVHPSETLDFDDEFEKFLNANLQNKKVVALGEYGLDYHFTPYDKQKQQEVFLKQLNIAKNNQIV